MTKITFDDPVSGRTVTKTLPFGMDKKQFQKLDEQTQRNIMYGIQPSTNPSSAGQAADNVSVEAEFSPEIQAVLDGFLFGFGDELLSGIQAARSDVSYEEALAANRAAARKFADENPGKALSLEMAGGLPYMFIPGLGIAKTASLLARTGRGAASGLLAGAAGGYGEGEGGVMNRLASSAMGAAFGGPLGAAQPFIGDAAGALYRRVFRGESFPKQSAQRRINEAFEADGQTPGSVSQTIQARGNPRTEPQVGPMLSGQAGQQAPQPRMETIADDAGPVTETLLEGAASRPTAALSLAERQLRARKDGRYGRVMQDTTDAFGKQPNYYKELDTINEARKTEAAPFYQAVDNFGVVDNPAINKILTTYKNTFEDAWPTARKLILSSNDAPDDVREFARISPKLFDDDGAVSVPLTATVLDYLQRGVREFADATKGSGTGPGLSKNYKGIQNELIEALNDVVVDANGTPVYKMARSIWHDSKDAERAIEKGKLEFMQMDPEEIERFLRGKSKTIQDAFKAGAVRSIVDKIGRKSDSNPANAMPFTNEFYRAKLKALINATADENESAADIFADLMRKIAREKKLGDVENRVISNSATARRLNTQTPQSGGGAAMEVANTAAGGLPGTGMVVNKMMEKITGAFSKQSDEEVARMLLAMP